MQKSVNQNHIKDDSDLDMIFDKIQLLKRFYGLYLWDPDIYSPFKNVKSCQKKQLYISYLVFIYEVIYCRRRVWIASRAFC